MTGLRKIMAIGLIAFFPINALWAESPSGGVFLVKDGKASSVLVIPEQASPLIRSIAADFVHTIERSTGAKIPIVTTPNESIPGVVKIALKEQTGMPPESYSVICGEGELQISGNDSVAPPDRTTATTLPTRWALNHILQEGLGVRWLWPGELGTYVPKATDLFVPEQKRIYQPRLIQRHLRIALSTRYPEKPSPELAKMNSKVIAWAENHQAGRRGDYRFGHAYTNWWQRFSKTDPDYFMQPPAGVKLESMPARYIKLRISNPAVIEQIARDYQASGAPDYWNVCPNDGSGFDLSPETRAWDIPTDLPEMDVWRGRVNLTPRYIEFWNRLGARLREINPNVTLCTYAYSAYRYPPPAERPLTTPAIVALVPRYHETELWQGWARSGATLMLRPNWWHFAANAPYLPLEEADHFLKMAFSDGMVGVDMDSIMGYWGTQGLNYYLVARLISQPELSKDEIIAEYTSAFGAGAPAIGAYFAYWQKIASEYRYTDPDGRFETLAEEGKIERNPGRAARQVLPILYTDEILAPAIELLDEAARAIGADNKESLARVEFLRSGLEEMKATRDLVAISRAQQKNPTAERLAQFRKQSDALHRLRAKLNSRHVIWNDPVTISEDRRQIYVEPRFRAPRYEETEEM